MARTCRTRRTNTSSSSFPSWSTVEFEEVQAEVVNYYRGHWIDHPAQSNLYQIPEPLRTQCLKSFLESRVGRSGNEQPAPANYEEWIHQAFGRVFADTFPAVYTRKYWTREPADLGTDWIGKRVYYPKVEDVTAGAKGPLGRSTYWVNLWRYPSKGGFFTYTHKLAEGAQIEYGKRLVFVNFKKRLLGFEDGTSGDFRDAGLDAAAAGADRMRRGRSARRPRGRLDAESDPAPAGARGRQASVGSQGAVAVRLRRRQDQHPSQHSGEFLAVTTRPRA